jgi:hypothetical protein
MPTPILIIALLIVIIGIPTYPYWSYKAWYKKLIKNSKHPNWKPFCGKNFLKDQTES